MDIKTHMKTHPLDIASILSLMVGLSSIALDSAFQSNLTALFGSYSPKIVAGIGMLGLLASQILRIYGAPSGTVLTDAPVVSVTTIVPPEVKPS